MIKKITSIDKKILLESLKCKKEQLEKFNEKNKHFRDNHRMDKQDLIDSVYQDIKEIDILYYKIKDFK